VQPPAKLVRRYFYGFVSSGVVGLQPLLKGQWMIQKGAYSFPGNAAKSLTDSSEIISWSRDECPDLSSDMP